MSNGSNGGNGGGEPRPNEQAPIREAGQLSPPKVRKPIYECARAVHVRGFIPHALVIVYANKTEVVGHRRPYIGDADISLLRALVPGDQITATQTAFGFTSDQSYEKVSVEHQPSSLDKPAVGPAVYACGRVVPVGGLHPSTRVEVYSAATAPVPILPANLIGQAECTGAWVGVVTSPLQEGWYVAARQVSCPETSHQVLSPPSDSLKIPSEPHPLQAPTLDTPVVGNDTATLRALYVGAEATVIDKNTSGKVLDGLANAEANWWPVNPSIQAGHGYEPHQKLCTPSPPGTVVTPTNVLSAPVLISPICPDDRTVTILGTVVNATVVLYRVGTPLPIGIGGAGPGEVELNVGPAFLPLKVGDILYVRQYLGSLISQPSNEVPVVDCRNVVTQHNDNHRTGAYLHETSLTPATVGGPRFGRLCEREVDGSPFAQVLYVRNVAGTPLGTKNLFLVATSTNMVYAFDADDHSPGASAGLAWKISLGPTRSLNGTEICRETWGPVGVTSTPVIDVSSQTIYLAARHWPGSSTPTPPGGSRLDGDYYLHALKLSDGTDRVAPRKIDGHDRVTGQDFQTSCQRNRPGLLLLNGIVYLGFATFNCDSGPYRGWVLGYRASDLTPAAIFATSKTAGAAGCGIWQSGNGLVGTDDGYLYFETGNEFHAGDKLGDSFVRLRVLSEWPGLREAGHFQPSNAAVLRDGDTDLGSGGPVLLPGQRLIGGGKQGRYYVLNPQTMTLTQDTTSPDPAKVGEGFQGFVNNDRNVAADRADDFRIYATGELYGPNIHGGPCYWRGPSYIYQMPEKDYLKAFFYDRLSGLVQQTPVLTATVRPGPGMPGGHSSLSANGDLDGIVWTCVPINDGQWSPTPGKLVAFDALTLKAVWQDLMPEWFAKFNPPTIADGKVFRPVFAQYKVPSPDDGSAPSVLGPGKVIVYGLTGAPHGGAPHGQWRSWRGGEDPEPRFDIAEKWRRRGGSGALAEPTTSEIALGDSRAGRRRDYQGWVFFPRGRVSVRQNVPDATCHRPPRQTVPVSASIFWSEATGAHVVLGEIRDEYLRQGAHESPLGYPIADERDTADGQGRVSFFERGEIVWYPDTGAEARVLSL